MKPTVTVRTTRFRVFINRTTALVARKPQIELELGRGAGPSGFQDIEGKTAVQFAQLHELLLSKKSINMCSNNLDSDVLQSPVGSLFVDDF